MSDTKVFGPTALLTPANAVTLVRLLAAPAFAVVLAMRGPTSWTLAVIWTVLSFSDGLDGHIAREQGTTRSGAFLDPLADKFLVLGALGALVDLHDVSLWPVLVIAFREVAMSGYRVFAARRGVSIPARPVAKLKTLVQDFAVAAALVPPIGGPHPGVARNLLWVATALTIISGIEYIVDGRRLLRSLDVSEKVPHPTSA